MIKRYKALAEMSTVFTVEFEDTEIPAGMDEYAYAQHLAEMGEFQELDHLGEFKIYEVMALQDDNTPVTYH